MEPPNILTRDRKIIVQMRHPEEDLLLPGHLGLSGNGGAFKLLANQFSLVDHGT